MYGRTRRANFSDTSSAKYPTAEDGHSRTSDRQRRCRLGRNANPGMITEEIEGTEETSANKEGTPSKEDSRSLSTSSNLLTILQISTTLAATIISRDDEEAEAEEVASKAAGIKAIIKAIIKEVVEDARNSKLFLFACFF